MSDFLQVICENCVATGFGIVGEHGLALMVGVGGRKLLFDTGQGLGLINNAKLAGVNLAEADSLVLSHAHKDHTGGIMDFLDAVGRKVIIGHPGIFEPRFAVFKFGDREAKIPIGIPWSMADVEAAGGEFNLKSEPFEIMPGVWFSGEIPMSNDFESTDLNLYVAPENKMTLDTFPDDAALFVITKRGLSIISGCAHRGIVNTMAYARELFGNKQIYAVIGGFHLINTIPERIDKTVKAFKDYGVKMVATGHCTGLAGACKLAHELGDIFQFLWAGRKLEI